MHITHNHRLCLTYLRDPKTLIKNYEIFTVSSLGYAETFQLVRTRLFILFFLWDTLAFRSEDTEALETSVNC